MNKKLIKRITIEYVAEDNLDELAHLEFGVLRHHQGDRQILVTTTVEKWVGSSQGDPVVTTTFESL
tara:strand:- start:77 stop:274 length:198 start_codon:yes stop_codon:yes gene_type:complete